MPDTIATPRHLQGMEPVTPASDDEIRRRIRRVNLSEYRSPVEIIRLAKLDYYADLRATCRVLIQLVAAGTIEFRQVEESGVKWPGFRRAGDRLAPTSRTARRMRDTHRRTTLARAARQVEDHITKVKI